MSGPCVEKALIGRKFRIAQRKVVQKTLPFLTVERIRDFRTEEWENSEQEENETLLTGRGSDTKHAVGQQQKHIERKLRELKQ